VKNNSCFVHQSFKQDGKFSDQVANIGEDFVRNKGTANYRC